MDTNTQLPNQRAPMTDEEMLARIRARREAQEENAPIRIPGWAAGAVILVIAVALWYGYQGLGVPDIPLCVVNTSSDNPMEIRLDGKRIGKANRMLSEDPSMAVMGVLKVGKHILEARDPSDAVIAQETLTVSEGSNGYLWTPLPDPKASFFFVVANYGYDTGSSGTFPFEGKNALREFPEWVTQWFKDNPKSVVVKKWAKSTFERALRFKRQE